MMRKKLSYVLPALNEQIGVCRTIQSIPVSLLKKIGYEVEIIVVDNGSTDKTAAVAKEAGATVISCTQRGYGEAYKAGFAAAVGDIIITADSDGSYPLEYSDVILSHFESKGCDFMTTNRFAFLDAKAMSFKHKIGNAILSRTLQLLYWVEIKDSQSGMWIFKREILPKLKLTANNWVFSQEIKIEVINADLSWAEIPIRYKERVGKSKVGSFRVGVNDFYHLFKKRLLK